MGLGEERLPSSWLVAYGISCILNVIFIFLQFSANSSQSERQAPPSGSMAHRVLHEMAANIAQPVDRRQIRGSIWVSFSPKSILQPQHFKALLLTTK